MKKRLSQIWERLRESFSVEESFNTTIETGKAVLEAATTLKEEGASLEVLKPVLQHSSSLLDVLCSPLAQVIGAGLPFVPMGIALLKFSRQMTQQEPTLEDCVFIVSQVAYLESVKEILSLDSGVNWDANSQNTEAVRKQLKKLNDIELDYQSASGAIACFHQSELAQAFNGVLLARLTAANIPNAAILTERVAWNTHRYLVKAWIESGDVTRNVIQPSFGDWQMIFVNEYQRFINGVLIFINEAQRLINQVLILINEAQRFINQVLILINEAQRFINGVQRLLNEAQRFINGVQYTH